jgi:hypothetical protein
MLQRAFKKSALENCAIIEKHIATYMVVCGGNPTRKKA